MATLHFPPTPYAFSKSRTIYMPTASLVSRHIIETVSYTTTPSFTPRLFESGSKSSLQSKSQGPTATAIVTATLALEVYRHEEESHEEQIRSRTSGNYLRAVAAQKLRLRRQLVEDAVSDAQALIQTRDGGANGVVGEMCSWSYNDWKRKMHLRWMNETSSDFRSRRS